jgi:hypothetical protein
MDRRHSYPPSAAAAAIALSLSICSAAAERVEHASQSEQVLAPLVAQANALAQAGHHEEAIPLFQRAVTIMHPQYGVFDLRQASWATTLAIDMRATFSTRFVIRAFGRSSSMDRRRRRPE